MSYIVNDPADFAIDSAHGFVRANSELLRAVPGGVARATATPAGEVAVVIGGGSGHYPAFAGLVGQGAAHAAAMGNVFASPSAQQVYTVAKSVATEAGVLLTYGNYAGDLLNFTQAEERLRAEGIPCQTVRVTDDVYSAGPDEREKRRGIAGDLAVFRAAGWAAAQGWDLDRVAAFAAHANDRTRTGGVAFTGCTLPGAAEPLFTIPAGQMAVGMGIHGEPGIKMLPLPTAGELAGLLVEELLGELPDGVVANGARAAVIVNGLGSVKGEELFLLYGHVAALLGEAGVEIVDPEVGEYATSFEMAGTSLTLFWLDEALEQAWTSPAYTPAYRKGAAEIPAGERLADVLDAADLTGDEAPATEESRAVAPRVAAVVHAIRELIDREADELGRLDAIAGDGDHGIGMQRGATAADTAATRAVVNGAGAGATLIHAGDEWADKAGGTSGALWGAGLRAAGQTIGNDTAPSSETIAQAVAAATALVQRMGGAQVGDKTLVDALVPFAETLTERVGAGADLAEAWHAAAAAATGAAQATADLLPRMGRARPHMEKSLGTPDPGAISLALTMTAAAAVISGSPEKED